MGFFNDFADAVEGTAKKVGKKATEIADSSKKAIETAAIKERLSREYEKLGCLIYRDTSLSSMVKASDEEYAAAFDKIAELKAELASKNSGDVKCSCGKLVGGKGNFCPYCGKKIR